MPWGPLTGIKMWLFETSSRLLGLQVEADDRPQGNAKGEAHSGVKRTPGPPILAARLPETNCAKLAEHQKPDGLY